MGLRRKGREIAIQTLYALNYSEIDSPVKELEWLNIYQEKLEEIVLDNHGLDERASNFAKELLDSCLRHIFDVDEQIKKHTINWNFERIADLDKSIMRIAVYELMFSNTPSPIIMNEAIEIAKRFSSENSSKFINGILNAICDEINKSKKSN